MTNQFGIMQGRLLPPQEGKLQCFPRSGWEREFDLAAEVPLDYIEWIFDTHGLEINPLRSKDGVADLQARVARTGVKIKSVCADYFMDFPLARCAESLSVLWDLLDHCKVLGVTRVVLPFVDNSAITPEEFDNVTDILKRAADRASRLGVELHLETSLHPGRFAELLSDLPTSTVKVNYDSGNSASLGYAPEEEFACIGPRIGSVHIKDRILNGGTVPLGSGNADFDAVFNQLRNIEYEGDFTLQVARDSDGNEVNWARKNLEFVHGYWTN